MTRSRVGILHYAVPPVIGGVEAVIQAHARELTHAGYPTTLIAGRGDASALIPEIDSQHAEILRMNTELETGQVPEAFDDMVGRLQTALQPLVASLDHLIIHNVFTKHFNLPLTAALHRLIDSGSIQHAIIWCHDLTWTSPHSRGRVHPGYPWDLLRTYRNDVAYVVVSEKRQEELAGLFSCHRDKIHVIYNGVDPELLLGISVKGMELINRLDLLNAGLVILMPVRITQAKNIEFALKVTAALKAKQSQPVLVITGPPDPHDPDHMHYFEALKSQRRQLGVEENVRFVYESGSQPDTPHLMDEQAVGELYRLSDVVFLPSHREGFGIPVLEAGLCGIPVVCTGFPAAQEVGRNDVNNFSTDQSPDDVAELLLDLIQANPLSRLRRRVRQEYTWRALFKHQIEPLLNLP